MIFSKRMGIWRGCGLGIVVLAMAVEAFGAGEPYLVRDINPLIDATVGSKPPSVLFEDPPPGLALGGWFYFAAKEGETGSNLWRTDGTTVSLLRSFDDGGPGLIYSELVEFDGKIYFAAYDAAHGVELWRSDGTRAGTEIVADISTLTVEQFAFFSNGFTEFGKAGGYLYFNADDGTHGRELWRTDGTEAGTQMVVDLAPGPDSGVGPVIVMRSDGTNLFFATRDFSSGLTTLWKTSGSGATRIDSFGLYSSEAFFDLVNGFAVYATGGEEPAVRYYHPSLSTGTLAAVGGRDLTTVNGKLYFSGEENFFRSLWVTDGTHGGTGQLPGSGGEIVSFPTDFFEFNDKVFFAAVDEDHGDELWTSDGTQAGTQRVIDLEEGFDSSYPNNFRVSGDVFYFDTLPPPFVTDPRPLWVSDGTAAGTSSFFPVQRNGTFSMAGFDGELFFWRTLPETGTEPWMTDGTTEGTRILADIAKQPVGSEIEAIRRVGNGVFFNAYESVNGDGLWRSDGTFAGTELLVETLNTAQWVTDFNGLALFSNMDLVNGRELWVSDGTQAGTQLLKDLNPGPNWSLPRAFTRVGNRIFFIANSPDGPRIWQTDGTEPGTTMIAWPPAAGSIVEAMPVSGAFVYFYGGNTVENVGIWRTDGTEAGTELVVNQLQEPRIAVTGNKLYYTGTGGGPFPAQPYHTLNVVNTQTLGPPVELRQITMAFSFATGVTQMAPDNGDLYFAERNASFISKFLKTDGTPAGTVELKRLDILNMTLSGGRLYLEAEDPTAPGGGAGFELWKSDGTPGGTVQVKDIGPGAEDALIGEMIDVAGTLYFTAATEEAGVELWKSDGTEAGTVMAADIYPGANSSSPRLLTQAGRRLFFDAIDAAHGSELWALDWFDASIVWADFDFGGEEWGTEPNPFDTLTEAVGEVEIGGRIRVKAGSSGETLRITKRVRIEAAGGAARIGAD